MCEFEARGFVFYVKFSGEEWKPFVNNGRNGHQKVAADQYLRSGQAITVISVPHVLGGMFEATFSVAQAFPSPSSSNIYMYTPEGRPPVQFRYCNPGFPEHLATRAAYWAGE